MSTGARKMTERIGYALVPLHYVLQDVVVFRDFLEDLGWNFEEPPASLLALRPAVDAAVENSVGLDNDVDVEFDIAVASLMEVFKVIADLRGDLALPADFCAEFPG